jgi:Phage integrase family
VSGIAPPAGASSVLFTRVPPGPAAPEGAQVMRQFPPRPCPGRWPGTMLDREQASAMLLAPPFRMDSRGGQRQRSRCLGLILDWLQDQPGATWQERWTASGAEDSGDWRDLAAGRLTAAGRFLPSDRQSRGLGAGLLLLVCGDVIRPDPGWLLARSGLQLLTGEMARARDPGGFAMLRQACDAGQVSPLTRDLSLRRIAAIMAAKGGLVGGITAGDCLELAAAVRSIEGKTRSTGMYFYQLLRAAGVLPPEAPASVRMFTTRGQLTPAELIGQYGIGCGPVRDLLADYLTERLIAADYSTLRAIAHILGKLFWRDLELHNPGISSLRLSPAATAGWKQRITRKAPRGAAGGPEAPRTAAANALFTVRAFYLDIAQWAVDDPARWGQWAAPCPVRAEEIPHAKELSRRKARMDQRTRERLPVLPALAASAAAGRDAAAARLAACAQAQPGEAFTAGGQELRRAVMAKGDTARTWAEEPADGRRRDLTLEEHRAFWAWAAIEVLRHTGIRIEELTELSHHSLVQYRLPSTGELIPLLQIAPSKTDAERLLVISPELADVLSAVITRIRGDSGAVPLVVSFDDNEKLWNPPMPLLFQRRLRSEDRPVTAQAIRELLNIALDKSGLTGAAGQPLRFAPHDFRRMLITDAILHGMPPHIAQLVAGHRDINTTMGYKAVYPEEIITGHRAFIARRRALRPGAEYRTPTDAEWEEFLGHFERRKLALGDCGRAYGTSCIHEHSCIRCPMLRVDPAQRHRLKEIRDNLTARVAEAEREGWAGEAEGLKISLAAAGAKLAEADAATARRTTPADLGMPAYRDIAGRLTTGPARP